MQNSRRMRRSQTLRQLRAQLNHFSLRQSASPKPHIQGHAGHQFADQKVISFKVFEIVDGLNRRMIQPRKNAGFIAKTLARSIVMQRALRQHLDGKSRPSFSS